MKNALFLEKDYLILALAHLNYEQKTEKKY